MKIEKLLSIGINLIEGDIQKKSIRQLQNIDDNSKLHRLNTYREESYDSNQLMNRNQEEVYDAKRLHQIILNLEELCFNQKVIYSPLQHPNEKGVVHVNVTDGTGHGITAQVKFFLVGNEETPFNSKYNSIHMIREMTGWNGILEVELPIGRYCMEISKGSEYPIINNLLTIKEHDSININCELIRAVNLSDIGWYGGDLHHHSVYSSPTYGGTDDVVDSPMEVYQSMCAMGLTYGALSDHHNTYNHEVWAGYKNDKFTPILSKEISTSNGHVMSLGIDEDIIYKIPEGDERTDENLRKEFIRISNRIKELDGMPQLNHPRDLSKAISWNPDFYDIIDIFETMEIWNGSNPMMYGTTNYKAFLLWIDLLEQGVYMRATTGSDTHNIKANDYHSMVHKLLWLVQTIKEELVIVPKEWKTEVDYLLNLVNNQMPLIIKWMNSNLTTGGVRTYVFAGNDPSAKNILANLKNGHSFLSNGPILIPSIIDPDTCKEIISGDTLAFRNNTFDLKVVLLANKPLTKLKIFMNGGKIKIIDLPKKDDSTLWFDYSMELKDLSAKGVKWIFLMAMDDCTNMAMSNPLFFNH